jgi:hypothetical protein
MLSLTKAVVVIDVGDLGLAARVVATWCWWRNSVVGVVAVAVDAFRGAVCVVVLWLGQKCCH